MDILFSDITVITMDDAKPVLRHGYVGVDSGKVSYTGERPPAEKAARTINGTRKLLMPGLVNAHSHLPMAVLRGYADDYTLREWLFEHIFPAESRLDERCVAAGARLGLAESIRFGIVSSSDMYFHLPQVAEAVLESGAKANITNPLLCLDMNSFNFEKDRGTIELRKVLAEHNNSDGGRLVIDAGLHGEYTSGPAAWRESVAFARENNLRIQLHLSETESEQAECLQRHGKTPAEILNDYGIFTRKTSAAHCCHITESDMDILSAAGVTAVHCPVSNLKLASGAADIVKMSRRGLNIALGTDGVCSNNNHDLFEEIKTAALLQKYLAKDPAALPAYEAVKMATVNGAAAQGRENETGRIVSGYDADLVMLDTDAPHLFPASDPFAQVAYSARGSDVCLTMVRGRILFEGGEFKTLDLEKIRHEIEHYVLPRLC